MNPNRHNAGTPNGGKFAPGQRDEAADIDLSEAADGAGDCSDPSCHNGVVLGPGYSGEGEPSDGDIQPCRECHQSGGEVFRNPLVTDEDRSEAVQVPSTSALAPHDQVLINFRTEEGDTLEIAGVWRGHGRVTTYQGSEAFVEGPDRRRDGEVDSVEMIRSEGRGQMRVEALSIARSSRSAFGGGIRHEDLANKIVRLRDEDPDGFELAELEKRFAERSEAVRLATESGAPHLLSFD